MSDAYIGEIRAFGFNFPPKDWMACDGSIQSVAQYRALFNVIGNRFGGNGSTTFALPNLSSNVVVGAGAATSGTQFAVGQTGGETFVLIDGKTMAAHTHAFLAANPRSAADSNVPSPNVVFASASGCTPYAPNPAIEPAAMAPQALTPAGGVQAPVPHNNMAPTLAVNFCICVSGEVPPRP